MKSMPVDPILVEKLKALLKNEKTIPVVVVSGSMEPVIRTGETVKLRYAKNLDDVQLFDIIVFYQNRMLICHMVVDRSRFKHQENFLITRGIAAQGEDLPVFEKDLLGIVEGRHVSPCYRWRFFVKKVWNILVRGS